MGKGDRGRQADEFDPFGEVPKVVRFGKMPFFARGVFDKTKGVRGGTFARGRTAGLFETRAGSFL